MDVYIVYEWYADSDDMYGQISRSKDILAIYDSLEKANKVVGDKPTKMGGLWSTWYTIEKEMVR